MKLFVIFVQFYLLAAFCGAEKEDNIKYNCDRYFWPPSSNDIELEVKEGCVFHSGTMRTSQSFNWHISHFVAHKSPERLFFLWIHHTKKTVIPRQLSHKFPNLVALRIEHTDLDRLDASNTVGLANIKNLYLGSNKIKRVSHDAFEIIVNMNHLSLNNNSISHLDDRTFEMNTFLQKISLSFNELTVITNALFSRNTELREIYLQGNHLQIIASDAFTNKPLLKTIDLKGNSCMDLSTFSQVIIDDLLDKVKETCSRN
jgi:hypothetical protein